MHAPMRPCTMQVIDVGKAVQRVADAALVHSATASAAEAAPGGAGGGPAVVRGRGKPLSAIPFYGGYGGGGEGRGVADESCEMGGGAGAWGSAVFSLAYSTLQPDLPERGCELLGVSPVRDSFGVHLPPQFLSLFATFHNLT